MAIAEQLRFLSGLIARPGSVGAIAPSGRFLARAMAAQIDPAIPGPVLELGPGTGAVTRALIGRGIAPMRITAIEYDSNFATFLAQRFPKIRVICGDAFAFEHTAEPFAAIVSSLPLLNFPVERRQALVERALAQLAQGTPFIQFSYGMRPPVAAPRGTTLHQAAFILLNLPPARVWVYRRN
jgi:phosphatidylethanolamine/phosphatidyl-N-methylethanolamine N-methyltransferase